MNKLPNAELVMIPGGTLITKTPEEGRQLAMMIARHTIHNIQSDLDELKQGRSVYSVNLDSLTAASQVVALEYQAIAAANNYWRG
ncbi:hexameric tyrosine-coordinated heme protein [Pseudovibrio sp. WM33]|uniref:hexameric tyrosine-coordinated heme protein n=1 Tax=Pseudovibrio sp. WM33 TaxID=1735585 RepID=UPI0007AE7BAF|nr:hexameric tyrosine-coordinated heme protein [Pseudovibrio sp. WM33]KZL25161.1 Hexameric tyrosine-coordinated heme protein (HTHP) [Pseudovibrio sp. WM33]